jgi:hypothetical protein
MRKLAIVAVASGVLGFAASSASAASYYVARAQPHDAKISFRVQHGTVDAGFTQTRDLTCGRRHFDTVSAGFDNAALRAGKFKTGEHNQRRHYRKVLAGHIDGDSATGRTRIKTSNGCETGSIKWEAKRVSKARWQKFNLPHFQPRHSQEAANGPTVTRLRGPAHGEVRKNRVKKGKLTFTFGSTDPDAEFVCRIDQREWKPCEEPERVRRVGLGRHAFWVKAQGQDRNFGTFARLWFRVVRRT